MSNRTPNHNRIQGHDEKPNFGRIFMMLAATVSLISAGFGVILYLFRELTYWAENPSNPSEFRATQIPVDTLGLVLVGVGLAGLIASLLMIGVSLRPHERRDLK